MTASNGDTLYDSVHDLADEAWLGMLIRSLESPYIDGVRLPGFPYESVQQITNNHSGRTTLEGAFRFYQVAREMLAEHASPLDRDSRILDFGCGWGRIARFFYKDIDEANVFGVDVNPKLIRACEQTLPPGQFRLIDPDATLPFADDQFNLVFANSVFSHLNERLHHHAIAEIRRILKPGGVALCTIIDEEVLDRWPTRSPKNFDWARSIIQDPDHVRRLMDAGELVWFNSGETGVLEEYGLAFVPLAWAKQKWPGLEMRGVRHDYGQAIVLSVKSD